MDEIGPVDYAVIAFQGNHFTGDIVPAIEGLIEAGTIRLIDAVFASKDEDGEIVTVEATQLAPAVRERLETLHLDVQGLVSEEDLRIIGEELEPNTSAAILVWENVWARTVAGAIRDAGGSLLAFQRLPHETVQAARAWALEGTDA
ncbi:MAG: DUF6325 family protein [Solirubrobacteraceae bacterium]|jgi:hypothetical protein